MKVLKWSRYSIKLQQCVRVSEGVGGCLRLFFFTSLNCYSKYAALEGREPSANSIQELGVFVILFEVDLQTQIPESPI